MIEMTLSSRHRIRNSSPGGLRPSTLPLGHGGSPKYWLSHVDGEKIFLISFKPPRPGTEPRTLVWKAAVLTTTLGPPPYWNRDVDWYWTFINDKYRLLKQYKNTVLISFFGCSYFAIQHLIKQLGRGITVFLLSLVFAKNKNYNN